MPRFLATADQHLGAGPDLGLHPGDRLAEQEEVWRATLALAREYECDAVLHGGDLFDKRRPTPEEVLAATRPLVEHRDEGGCPVVMVLGNHERSGVSEATMPAVLSLSDFMHVAHAPEVDEFAGVSIAMLPWAPVARIVAAHDGGDRDDVNAYAAELLVATARGLRAKVDGPAILLSHFMVSGSALPSGLPVEQTHEPVLELAELEALGFDACVFGHVHKGQVFGEGTFYVGSPMPVDFGETGYDHGCFILEPDTLSGAYVPRFVPIASRRLVTLDYSDVDELADDVASGMIAGGEIVKVRLAVTREQAQRLDVAALKRDLYEAGAYKVASVSLDVEREERARVEGLSEEIDEMQALRMWCESVGINGPREAALVERHERYAGAVRV